MIKNIEYPELFIGLVAPVGTDTKTTVDALQEKLEAENYDVVLIKVTNGFKEISNYLKRTKKVTKLLKPQQSKDSYSRISSYIKLGNHFRKKFKDDSVLASHSMFKINQARKNIHKKRSNTDEKFSKTAFIIDQLKREEEVDLLRTVYGRLFFQVSVYSKKESRIDRLSRIFAHENTSARNSKFRDKAIQLIEVDENEEDDMHGQRVSKIFHNADFIINDDYLNSATESQISRFLELLFSSNSISPTKYEYGMYAAKGAALRTLDLSRQVGAAIFRASGEILSLGSNEVPKAGGGTVR